MGVIFRGDSASCACLNLGSKAAYPSPTFPTEQTSGGGEVGETSGGRELLGRCKPVGNAVPNRFASPEGLTTPQPCKPPTPLNLFPREG